MSPTFDFVIAILLTFYIIKKHQVGNILIAFIVYLSLHYGYAILVALAGNGYQDMYDLHMLGSPIGTKIVGGMFVFICLSALLLKVKLPLRRFLPGKISNLMIILFLLFLFASALFIKSYIFTENSGSQGVSGYIFKSDMYSILMWIFALIISIVLSSNNDNFERYRADIKIALFLLFIVINVVGVYEIASGIAYATTGYAIRASSTLYNPNIFGIWAALMVLGVNFLFEREFLTRNEFIILTALGVVSLCISASRSGFLLSSMMLFFVAVFLRRGDHNKPLLWRDRLYPLILFLNIFIMYAIIIISLDSVANFNFLTSLHANIDRFIYFPYDLAVLVFNSGHHLWEMIFNTANTSPTQIVQEVIVQTPSQAYLSSSISGRFLGEIEVDNAYVYIYEVSGSIGLMIWFFLLGFVGWLGARRYMRNPCVNSAYSLIAFIGVLASGLFMRSAQIFPIWIFISIILGLSLRWWLYAVNVNIDANR